MNTFLFTTFEKLMAFRPARLTAIERLGQAFYLACLQGTALQGVTWIPGQTIQFLVGSLTKRAYTPMDVDSLAGTGRFLFYRHGQGPGSAWAASLRAGDLCKLMRPKNSIDFTKEGAPALFFGDETSFAAAQALQLCRREKESCHFILEVDSLANARAVTSRLGLERVTLLLKTSDGSHLEEAARTLTQLASSLVAPSWFFTGCAPSIQDVRKRLKAEGISLGKGAVKAYWSPGRQGLD